MISERADLHQRARVGVEAITSAMVRGCWLGERQQPRSAGALVPSVWPGRGDRTDTARAVTTIQALPNIPPATLRFAVPAHA